MYPVDFGAHICNGNPTTRLVEPHTGLVSRLQYDAVPESFIGSPRNGNADYSTFPFSSRVGLTYGDRGLTKQHKSGEAAAACQTRSHFNFERKLRCMGDTVRETRH